MDDVIIYNESWDIDKLSPYTTFVMEGSIIDGLKRLWHAFLNLLKRIKQRLQYTFNSEARTYRKVVQGLKIPSVVADWKETRCTKWDYSALKELVTKGIELCDCILNIEDVFENVEVTDGHATWTPSELSKIVNNNNDIIKINDELKTITEKKRQAPVEKGQTVYDLATEWVEIYELVVRYYMRHDKVIEFTKEMDKIVKSLPEDQATVTTKLMQNWIAGLSYLHNAKQTGPTGVMINARVDSRDGFVQIKTMLDENSKLLEDALKNTREANAEADRANKDSEKFMRNNKEMLKKYNPWKEYYTKGMTDMDTIIYKDDLYDNDEQITTESVDEGLTLYEVNAYIEYTMNDLHDAMELRNQLIQESDDDTVEDFEESDDNFADDYEESARRDISSYDRNHRYNSDPRKDAEHYKKLLDSGSASYESRMDDIERSETRIKEDDDLRRKRVSNRNTRDNLDKMSSREYINAKRDRDYHDSESKHARDVSIGNYHDERSKSAQDKMDNIKSKLADKKKADEFKKMTPMSQAIHKKYEKYKTEYYSDAIIRNYDDEPVEEETTYCLKTNDMFTTESYDEPTGPDRFVQEMVPDKYITMSLDTAFTIRAAAKVFVICKAVESICDSLIYNKILGRFPSEMKRVMDIIKESKDGTINTKTLRMALSDLKHEAKTVSGYNVISFKAKKNFTQTEREELRKLINITSDLEHMLTDKPDKAASRRISARIEDFVKQSETVMKLINRGKNPGDVVKEYMS